MKGISFQLGPRSVGRGLVALWHWKTRLPFLAVLLVLLVLVEAALAVVFFTLNAMAARSQAPTAFCPSGQHVVSVTASGWPDCAVNP